MRNYASKRAKKGKLAYRTPDRFIPHQIWKITRVKSSSGNKKHPQQRFGTGFIYKQVLKVAKEKCRIKKP